MAMTIQAIIIYKMFFCVFSLSHLFSSLFVVEGMVTKEVPGATGRRVEWIENSFSLIKINDLQ